MKIRVLAAIFSALLFMALLASCAGTGELEPSAEPSPVIEAGKLPSEYLSDDNPIDAYFDGLHAELIQTTVEERVFYANYAACWKEELLHAYDLLLERAHPAIDYPREYITRSRDAFLEFVENNAWMGAYAGFSDAFGDEAGGYGDTINQGTGLPGEASRLRAVYYRNQTFYLYDLLRELDVAPDFVFDSGVFDEFRNVS